MTVEIGLLIALITGSLSIATFCIGRKSSSKKEGEEAGALKTDLSYIKKSVDRIETRLDDSVARMEGRIDQLSSQVTTVTATAAGAEKTAKSAHKRLDEHLQRGHGQTVVSYDPAE